MVDSIDEEDSSEILVTSLNSIDSSKQVFALHENDMSSVSIKDIIGVLPEPILSLKGERIFYEFPKPIDISEKMWIRLFGIKIQFVSYYLCVLLLMLYRY